mgnify:CR=1 FL=1
MIIPNNVAYMVIIAYIAWLFLRFDTLGYACITDFRLKGWESIYIVSTIALVIYTVHSLTGQQGVNNKDLMLLFGSNLVAIMFFLNLIQSCEQIWYEHSFRVVCVIVVFAIIFLKLIPSKNSSGYINNS